MVMKVDFMRQHVTVPIGQGNSRQKERRVGKEPHGKESEFIRKEGLQYTNEFDLIVVRSWLRERAVMSFRRFTPNFLWFPI